MDMMTAIFAANKAKNELMTSGGIGYTETSAPIVFIPNGSYESYEGGFGVPIPQLPKAGDKIELFLDGEVYTTTAREVYVEEGGGNFLLIGGNTVIIDGVDTGEPFTLIFDLEDGAPVVLVVILAETGTESTTTHTVEASCATETVHPIDPKYIPSPVVDMDDVIGALDRGETPATSLDDDRVKAIVEGYKNHNLVFKYNQPADVEFAAGEVFTVPVASGASSYSDGSGTVYSFAIVASKVSMTLWYVMVAVYSDGSNAVIMAT